MIVPDAAPGPAGVKLTDIVQLVAGASTAGQLFVSENGPAAESASVLMLLPPKFVTVMFCGVLAEPTFCEKSSVGGLKLIAEGRGLGKEIGTAP